MHKLLVALTVTIFIFACSGGGSGEEKSTGLSSPTMPPNGIFLANGMPQSRAISPLPQVRVVALLK